MMRLVAKTSLNEGVLAADGKGVVSPRKDGKGGKNEVRVPRQVTFRFAHDKEVRRGRK